mmetsp:Transcript_38975/g.62231  ORF Transcript_38975/g.62231 Transcript_38975/m.62231 type:complete len:231 (+) Transcript_38975:24-716(+)
MLNERRKNEFLVQSSVQFLPHVHHGAVEHDGLHQVSTPMRDFAVPLGELVRSLSLVQSAAVPLEQVLCVGVIGIDFQRDQVVDGQRCILWDTTSMMVILADCMRSNLETSLLVEFDALFIQFIVICFGESSDLVSEQLVFQSRIFRSDAISITWFPVIQIFAEVEVSHILVVLGVVIRFMIIREVVVESLLGWLIRLDHIDIFRVERNMQITHRMWLFFLVVVIFPVFIC